MAEIGRPSKLTHAVQETIVTAIQAGNYATVAAACAGIDPSTYHRWLERGDPKRKAKADEPYREFRAAVDQAKAEAEVRLVTQIAVAGEKHWGANAWLLARRFPKRWGTQRQGKGWRFGRSRAKTGDGYSKPRLDLRRLTTTELRKIRGRASQSG